MVRDEKISLFYRQFHEELREIIDYVSGLIFEFFPLIHEEIREDSLKYKSVEFGSLFLITVQENSVYLYISKKSIVNKEKINSHLLKENKKYYFFKYDSYKRIKREELVKVFQLII